ncbi:MAG: tetratricopeptide repeat protein, partial [bacterium]
IIDARFYHYWAQEVARGKIIGEDLFFMSPLYPYVLGLIYAVLGSEPFRAMIVQSLMSGISIGLFARWVREWLNPRAATIAAWSFALYAPFIFYDGTLLNASLSLFLSVIILYLTHQILHSLKPKGFFKLGVAIGLAGLVRPMVLLFPILLFIELLRRYRNRLGGLVLGLLGGIGVVLLPIGVRNFLVAGEFVLTAASAGVNFYIGNNPDATGIYWEAPFLTSWEPPYEAEDYRREASQIVGRELTITQAGRFWLMRSLDWAIREPGKFFLLWLKKIFYFFNRTEFANNISIYIGKELSPILRYNFWGWWLLAPLGLGGLILLVKMEGWRTASIPVLWGLTYLLGSMMFFVSTEYRLPATLSLLAGWGYLGDRIIQRIKEGSLSSVFRYGVIGLLFLPVVNWRTPFIARGENSRMDWFNMGNTLLKEGRYEEATDRFQRSLRIDPYFSEALLRLAEAYYRAGKIEEVVEVGRRVGLPKPEEMVSVVQMEALKQAYRSLNTGDVKTAVQEFTFAGWSREKVEAETSRVRWMQEARLFYDQGELDSALLRFHHLAHLDTFQEPAFLYNIGFIHWQKGNLDSAEYWAREALSRDSMNPHSAYLLVRVLNATDRIEEAEKIIKRINPDYETRQQILAEVREEMDSLIAQKRYREALEVYGRYGKLGYDIDPEDKMRLGRLQVEVGNYELGLKLLSEAEAAFLRDPIIPLSQGKALLYMGRGEEAIELFRRCVALDPHNVEARIYLARLYLWRNLIQEAWRELEAIAYLEITDSTLYQQYQTLYDTIKARL